MSKQTKAQQQEPVAWMHWLHGPVRLFLNKDEAQMELDRLNREYPVDADDRKMRPLIFGDTPPAQQEIDWKDQYEKQKRRADMWVAKYEADIGPLEKAVPQTAQQEPVQCPICRAEDSPYPKCGHVTYVEHPAQQEHVVCCGEFETCTQACTPRGRFLGKREALAEQPAQQQEPSFGGVLFAVEEAIRNGDCPWQIESAFDEYDAERKAAHGVKGDA